ncbi:MAG: hypothetical protein JW850_04375 [Thermoflexales bacterium]|nr:hypothetical protein [Thermoflexales bacterium]
MLNSILDLSLDEFIKCLTQALDNLYNPGRLAGNLLESLFLQDFCQRHPEYLDPQQAVEPALREVLYRDVMPQTKYAKYTDVRAGVVVAATYFHFDKLPPPRRSYHKVDDILYDPELFQIIAPIAYSEKVIAKLLPEGGITEPTFRRVLTEGRRCLAEAILDRERALCQSRPAVGPLAEVPSPPPDSPFPVPSLAWLPTFRQHQVHQIEQMVRADGTIVARDELFLPRQVTPVRIGGMASSTISLERAFPQSRRFALLGPPGGGKTTALRRAALAEIDQDRLAAWISLPEYAFRANDVGIRDFLFEGEIEPLCETTQDVIRARSEQATLERNGQLVYYLDDWDRLPDEVKPLVAERIRALPSYRLALWQEDTRIPLDEDGLWELTPLTDVELCRLVELLLATVDHRAAALEKMVHMLDREAGFRDAAKSMPLLVDIGCRQVETQEVVTASVVREAIINLFRRVSLPPDFAPERACEMLAFALRWIDDKRLDQVERRFFRYPDFTYACQVQYNVAPEAILSSALHAGLLLADTPGVYRFPSAIFQDVLVGAGLSQDQLWSHIAGQLAFRSAQVLALVRHMAALNARLTSFKKIIDAVTKVQPKTGLEWVCAGVALCEKRRAGYPDTEMERTVLAKVSLLAQEDTGIAMRVSWARLLGCFGYLESANEFMSMAADAHCDACDREVTVRCLSSFPTEGVVNYLANLVAQGRGDRLEQAALGALLDMSGEMGLAAVVSLVRQGSSEVRVAAIQAMLKSGRWMARLKLEELGTEPEIAMLIEQSRQRLQMPLPSGQDWAGMTTEAFDRLSTELKAQDPKVRAIAAHTLGQMAKVPPMRELSQDEREVFARTFKRERDLTRRGVPVDRARGLLAFDWLVRAARSDRSRLVQIAATEGLANPECREALLSMNPPFLPPLWTMGLCTRLDPLEEDLFTSTGYYE